MSGIGIACDGLVHIYRSGGEDIVAIRGVDLDVAPGETLALVGPSGSGKSTLLNLFAGLLPPSAGRLTIGDADLGKLNERERARLRSTQVGTVLQGAARNLLPYATALDNVRFAQRAVPRRVRSKQLPAEDLLRALDLEAVAHEPVQRLSGGEQQRVALAVGVANGPGLLLADEPTSQLDRDARGQVLGLLTQINEQFGTTVVLVTHDPDISTSLHRSIAMRDGRIGSEGRRGVQYAVVAKDGSLPLPDHLLEQWPPGTQVSVEPDGDSDHLRITRRLP